MPTSDMVVSKGPVWRPNLAVSSWSLQKQFKSGQLDIFRFPEIARDRLKLDYVEVLSNHLISQEDEDFQKLGDAARSAGVRIICLALDNDFTLRGDLLAAERAKTERQMYRAHELGIPLVRLNPGMRGDGTDPELIESVAKTLTDLVPIAQELNVQLALENHQLLGLDPNNILKILKAVDPPGTVGICLDLGNFFPEQMESGPKLLAPLAVHVHAKCFDFGADGKRETTIDYLERLRELKAAGYSGFVSIEWEGSDDLDCVDNIWKARRLIDRCYERLNRVSASRD